MAAPTRWPPIIERREDIGRQKEKEGMKWDDSEGERTSDIFLYIMTIMTKEGPVKHNRGLFCRTSYVVLL